MTSKLLAVVAVLSAALAAQEATKVPSPVSGPGKPAPVAPQATPGPSHGNAWFPVVDQDLGTYFTHESALGHFKFQNPRSDAVTWKALVPSCQCTGAQITVGSRHYELRNKPTKLLRIEKTAAGTQEETITQIEIGPKESGEVEVHMEMNGISGPRQASIDIHTTDPDTPMIKLNWRATGAQMFLITPAEVNLNQMIWNEKREFTVTVTSPVQHDFNITRMDDAGEDFKVAYEKALKDGVATWTIKGSYGPVTKEPGGGGVLKFYTDVTGEPTFLVRVSAFVKGPLEVKPGSFLTLGMIRKGNSKAEKIVFEPNDGTDLDAPQIRLERLTIDPKFVTTRKTKEGKKLVIELEVSADAPQGLLRGDLVVELNHPVIKEKRILFNGFVR